MQHVMIKGRLAQDPEISSDNKKAVFRLIENRTKDKTVGFNCVSWNPGLNEKVIAVGMAKGGEVMVTGHFVDTRYTAQSGEERYAKELVVDKVVVLDWAEDRTEQRQAA